MLRTGVVFAAVVLVMALVVFGARDRPTTRDLERIRSTYQALFDDVPRPTGSAASKRTVERIEQRLRGMRLAPEIQQRFVCGPNGLCGFVSNVLVRIGAPTGPAILVSAHHDTVAASPGALDDGVGVTVLFEIAADLLADPLPSGAVILLFSDGEELALNGARAFVEEHRWMSDVAAMLAVEALGAPTVVDDGAMMGPLVRAYQAAGVKSYISSANTFPGIGGASDAAPFRAAGVPSATIQSLGEGQRYHTPRDTFAAIDPVVIAGRADAVLPWLRELVQNPPPKGAQKQTVVTFTLPLLGATAWAEGATPVIAFGALLLAAFVARKKLTFRGGFTVAAATGIGLVAAVVLLVALRKAGILFGLWTPAPWAARALPVLIGLAVIAYRKLDAETAWAGGLLTLAGVGLAASVLAPGVAPHAILPVLIGALCYAPLASSVATPLVTAALIASMYPFAGLLNAVPSYLTQSFFHAMLVPALAPFMAGISARLPALAVAIALVILAIAPRVGERPMEQSTVWLHREGDRARWIVQQTAPRWEMARAADFVREETPFDWWQQAPVHVATATIGIDAAPPELVGTSSASGWSGTLRSPRGALAVILALPASAGEVRLEGARRPIAPSIVQAAHGLRLYMIYGGSVRVDIDGPLPLEVEIADFDTVVPENMRGMLRRRPPTSQPAHSGDGTVISRRVTLTADPR